MQMCLQTNSCNDELKLKIKPNYLSLLNLWHVLVGVKYADIQDEV